MKKGLKHLGFIMLALMVASCVGNKKLVYLQDKDAKGEERFFPQVSKEISHNPYVLKPGDVLFINMEKFRVGEEIFSISNFQQMNRLNQVQHPYLLGHTITADSTIDLSLIGTVKVAGNTVREAQDMLTERAQKQYPGSTVEVFQLDGTVTVVGEVNNPGRIPIFKTRNSIFDVIAQTGDMKDFADRSNVRIIREANGQQEVFVVDLNDVSSMGSKGYYVQNDDIVVVSPLKRKKYTTANIQWLVSSVTALVAVASLVVSINRIQ